eukprot:5561226-Amphidinium_carterae.1
MMEGYPRGLFYLDRQAEGHVHLCGKNNVGYQTRKLLTLQLSPGPGAARHSNLLGDCQPYAFLAL